MNQAEDDANGNPKYSDESQIAVQFDAKYSVTSTREENGLYTFDAAGPAHHIGSGWITGMYPIRTRAGDIEPVYLIRVYWVDGAEVPEDERRFILVGEVEITGTYKSEPEANTSDTEAH